MVNLKAAHRELFKRSADEVFSSLDALLEFTNGQRERSVDRWHPPEKLAIEANGTILASLEHEGSYAFNDWSFGQLCRLASVNKDTLNRLSPATARQALRETMPTGRKPLQILTEGDRIRSIHGTQYARLWNEDLVKLAMETDFTLPHEAVGGGKGLYAGEQDLFLFLIDPTGWVEIGEHAFAPGMFLWNSEVGKRSYGVQTFWYQSVCANHIVWDATEVVDWSRKHTGDVTEGLESVRRITRELLKKRDERKDGFVEAIRKAMGTRVGVDSEACLNVLSRKGIKRTLAKKALEMAAQQGGFSVWCVVDALTRLAQETQFVGARTEVDEKASQLLQLAL